MEHGFYAVMGGLAIRNPNELPESHKFLPGDSTKNPILFDEGILQAFVENNSTDDDSIDLSREEIKSKTKASGLAKSLVCVQASWFIAQVLTRRKFSPILARLTKPSEHFHLSFSHKPHTYQSTGAEYCRSCDLRSAHLLSLVGKAI